MTMPSPLRNQLSSIEIKLLEILVSNGPIRGTAQVGYLLWPDRKMQPQGAALAAGKVLRALRDRGLVNSTIDHALSKYEIAESGCTVLKLLR